MKEDAKNPVVGKLPPPFFIVGCPRAGTTLVAQLLDSHSRIAVYLETQYYTLFRPDLHHYGDLSRLPNLRRLILDLREILRVRGKFYSPMAHPPEVEEFLESLVAPTFEGVLQTLLYLYARRQNKVRSGDKTPDHYAYLPEILEKFPDSPVIFVIRDPRDAVLSIREAFGSAFQSAVWCWNAAFRSYEEASRPVQLIRYEELVQQPQQVLKTMCDYLGESYEPTMLRFFERNAKLFSTIPSTHTKLLGPVDSGSVGRFRQMSSHEIEQIEAACAGGMEALGYPFTSARPQVMKMPTPTKLNFVIDRLHFYWKDVRRCWPGLIRWKIVLRLRVRYLLTLGPWRN